MIQENKPIRRNKNLVPLSQEHHHGLVFATRLKKGVERKTEINILRDYTLGFWDDHLEHHFIMEEKHLLPFLPEKQNLTNQFIHEHTIIRELIKRIRKPEVTIEIFQDFSLALNEHIRFEERQLFPWAEDHLTQLQLDKVGKALNAGEVACYNFKPEFWKV